MVEVQGYRVLVELIPYENDTIELNESYKEVQQMAKVVGIGCGRRFENGAIVKPDVKVGDKVIIEQTGGTNVEVDGKKYQIVSPDNIVGGVE
jgi:chaperonin GroES